MILYRGTPRPESLPRSRAFHCVFFAFDDTAVVDFATDGEQAKRGYIQQYEAPDTLRLYDLDEDVSLAEEFLGTPLTHARFLDLLHYPPDAWVAFLQERGFHGVLGGFYGCLWDFTGLRLLRRWRLEYDAKGRRYRRLLVLET